MAAAKEGYQGLLNNSLLAKNHAPNLSFDSFQTLSKVGDLTNSILVGIGRSRVAADVDAHDRYTPLTFCV
jgi:hypothetical protein